MKSLVSVIIPTYNRSQLIVETIHSIQAQTYPLWECIVVDDGSLDGTDEVLEKICLKEKRVKYFKRPKERQKGANACRNFGFEKCKGDYVIWFDSDDLMTPDHIEKKVDAIQNSYADFVVAQTTNFQNRRLLEPYKYEKKSYGIKSADFILLKIHWYTYDVLLKREIAEKISWNEEMKSWQDYNYFCKMLLTTENGTYLNEVLTHRRLHSSSIQKDMHRTRKNFSTELLQNRLLTFKDIHQNIVQKTRKELIFGMMNLCFDLAKYGSIPKDFFEVSEIVKTNLGKKSQILFNTSVFCSLIFKKGFLILEKAKNRNN